MSFNNTCFEIKIWVHIKACMIVLKTLETVDFENVKSL